MAYTMTHILIAEKLYKEFNKKIDYATYILGSTAPDAVHVLADYTSRLKEKSHIFPTGARWGEVSKEDDEENWLESISQYYMANRRNDSNGFFEGYIIHLLSDVYCAIHFYEPFIKSITGNIGKKKNQFKEESYGVNYYFYKRYQKEKNLYQLLSTGKAETMDGVIDKKTIEERISQLFEFEFKYRDISNVDAYEICTVGEMEKMVEGACEFIIKEIENKRYKNFFNNGENE